MSYYLKSLAAGRVPPYQGGEPLPVGEWLAPIPNPVLCERGWHALRWEDVPHHVFAELWVVELSGTIIVGDDKVAAESMRLIRQVDSWDRKAYGEACATAGKAYGEACAPAGKAYDEACAPAGKAYDEARATARKAYDEARATARKAYDEACAPAGKAYDEACATARKAYDEACATAGKAYDEACAPARKAYGEACATARKAYDEACATALSALTGLNPADFAHRDES